jgi:predicted dehydrogenase
MINAAIFGLGRWGRNLVNAVEHSEVVRFKKAVVTNPSKHLDFAKEKYLEVTADPNEVLLDPSIEMIVLATPHLLHLPQITAAAKAGKAVFCEKPLALNLEEAQRAVAVCQEHQVLLGVGHDKRFWPSMQHVQQVVRSGELGRLIHIEGIFTNENLKNFQTSWRDLPENVPGGNLTATGIHIVDAFTNLMGPIKSVEGIYRQMDGGTMDTLALLVDFESGATGLLSSPRPSPVFWRVHVFGQQGNIESRGPLQSIQNMSGKEAVVKEFASINALQFQLEAFARAIENKTDYLISPQEILNTVAAFEASTKAVDS